MGLGTFMPIDYEAEYNNRARVPEHPQIIARWKEESAAYRKATTDAGRAELGLSYGGSPRQIIDIFDAAAGDDPPVVLFIHGGYWRSFEPQTFSHLARGLNERNVIVAIAGYDLCPQVSVGDIVAQMRKACLFLWERYNRRIRVCGHSAGGHLAACMIATDWPAFDPTAPHDLVPAAYAISGLFDLVPFLQTSINRELRLDEKSARSLSPLGWTAPAGCVFDAVVGSEESGEYLRQSKTIVEEWAAKGVRTRYGEIVGANHFTAIDPLTDPKSDMVERICQMCGQAQSQ
jgi:arylformamidase